MTRLQSTSRPLPETTSWSPRDASRSLQSIFAEECMGAEQRILQALAHEKRFVVDNFDTGGPFEAIVRREIEGLMPRRYAIARGGILDRHGKSAGDCDIVIFNNTWFTPVKSATAGHAESSYMPIESVYAVGEVKQTLSATTLDEAMEKLVRCHRLDRPRTFANRIVENREGVSCPHGLTNPLFSFIVAGAVEKGEQFTDLINRFFDICKQLKRLEVVRALCVLGEGTVAWSFRDIERDDEVRPALFVRDDLFHPIFPAYSPASHRSPFLFLLQSLHQSLFHVVLGPEDLSFAYGIDSSGIRIPNDEKVALPPDDEWLQLLAKPCSEEHS
jgi:hypothetical protein